MEYSGHFLEYAALIALYLFAFSMVFPLFRLFKGPSLPDRVVALDQIGVIIVGMMICEGVYTRERMLLDVVMIVSVILVFSSMIIARFLYKQNNE